MYILFLKSEVLPNGPTGRHSSPVSYESPPSLHCKATNTGPVYRAACLLTLQLSPLPNYTAW